MPAGVAADLLDGERSGAPVPVLTLRRAVRHAVDGLRWDDRHVRLAAHPVFRHCTRAEIRTLARSGDEVDVSAGTVLLQEDGIGYWLVVVVDGALRLARRGVTVGRVAAGGHVGDVAILGFGPQPATAVAETDARVFVMGRRNLLDLTYRLPGLQRGLLPGVLPDAVDEHLRSLRAEGAAAWRRVPQLRRPRAGGDRASAGQLRFVRRVDRGNAFVSLARAAMGRTPVGERSGRGPTRLSRRARVAIAAAAGGALAIGGLLYHPPLLVVRPGDPVDVVADVTLAIQGRHGVEGPAVDRPTGRYLLTAVDVEQPNAFGALWALATDEETVAAGAREPGVTDATARRMGRRAFVDSRLLAVEVAARRAGVDPAAVRVEFRARDLSGPSAGLVYALALADLLDPADLARGRTIAATGSLDVEGRVGPVGFVALKAASARAAGADLFLVPAVHAAEAGAGSAAVRTFDEAVAELQRPAR